SAPAASPAGIARRLAMARVEQQPPCRARGSQADVRMAHRAEPCLHCRTPIPAEVELGGFCCSGCREVHRLLGEQGLSRWYEIAGGATAPAPEPARRSLAWLAPL